jgi:hypothetical protein
MYLKYALQCLVLLPIELPEPHLHTTCAPYVHCLIGVERDSCRHLHNLGRRPSPLSPGMLKTTQVKGMRFL